MNPVVREASSHSAQFRPERHLNFGDKMAKVNALLAQRGEWYRQRYGKPFIPHMESPVKPDAQLAAIESQLSSLMPGIIAESNFNGVSDPNTLRSVADRIDRVNLILNQLRATGDANQRAALMREMREMQAVPASLISSPHVGTRIITGGGFLDHTEIYNALDTNHQSGLIVSGHLITIPLPGHRDQSLEYFIPQRDLQTNVWVTQEVLTAGEVADMKGSVRRARAHVSDVDKNLYSLTTRPKDYRKSVADDQVTLPVFSITANNTLQAGTRAVLLYSQDCKGARVERFTAHDEYRDTAGVNRIR